MNDEEVLIESLDQSLPQTQCQLCHFSGCKPYAIAMAKENAPINRCLPGGIEVLNTLGGLLKQDPSPFLEEMARKTKSPQVAEIREAECIGCTKCIQACPVDAIIGASKQMHTIITDACTGCELCIKPCPVDCIDLKPSPPRQQNFKAHSRQRYLNHNARKQKQDPQQLLYSVSALEESETEREAFIRAAVERARFKKNAYRAH